MRILTAALAAALAVACSGKEERSEPASAPPEKVEPPAAAAPADAGAVLAPQLVLSLTADGKTFLADRPVEQANLAAELGKVAAHRGALVIAPDTRVPHGRVVEIMELAKRMGVDKMSIRTEASP